jgi:hypothetical protein
MKKLLFAGAGAVLALSTVAVLAQTPGGTFVPQVVLPQVSSINAADLFQDIVNGFPIVGNVYASGAELQAYLGVGTPSRVNSLVGGDASTNTFVHGTAGAQSTSTTPAYDGPTMWGQWSTASSGVTVSQDSTAADLPAGFQDAFKLAHTNTTAGKICTAQEVESVNSTQFQSQTAEADFHAIEGAGYTGGSTFTASIITGTGQNQGLASLEAGTWTGQTSITAAVTPISATTGRYAAFGAAPSGTTEIALQFCYTATTTDTNDYVALAGIQLVRNPAATAFVSSTVGYNDANNLGIPVTAFYREDQAQASVRQERYAYEIADNQTATTYVYAMGQNLTTTSSVFLVPFPVPMWEDPTGTASASTAFGNTATAGSVTACGSTDFSVVTSAATPSVGKVACSSGATGIAGGATQLVSEDTGATVVWSAEF